MRIKGRGENKKETTRFIHVIKEGDNSRGK